MEKLPTPSGTAGQSLPQGGTGGRSVGRTEEAKASGNALDTPTSVWSEMARTQAEPHTNRRKQMTTDASRLMRPGVVASTEHNAQRLLVSIAKLAVTGQRVATY
jgi:hypothetical protein